MENTNIIEYTLDRFTWEPAERLFVAESSDFGALRDGGMRLSRIYNDACDEGFRLVGQRDRVTYCLAHQEVRDGDLLWVDFQPTPESERRVPACVGTRVRIFND
jgi:hypothetical protein